jgi:hypothetical protein
LETEQFGIFGKSQNRISWSPKQLPHMTTAIIKFPCLFKPALAVKATSWAYVPHCLVLQISLEEVDMYPQPLI